MKVVFPFCSADAALLEKLLGWIQRLGMLWEHHALLIADGEVDLATGQRLLDKARGCFGSARIQTIPHVAGWIAGSNALFKHAAESCAGKPFLWIEPDATPICPGWLDKIEQEYQRCGKPFSGAVVKHTTANLPNPYLEGCAVYPSDAWARMSGSFSSLVSWTLACASAVVPHSYNSPLFQHLWGEPNLSPTFVAEGVAKPRNGFHLRHIRQGAVLFHRCKDASLMDLLRKKFFPEEEKFDVLLPVFHGDVELAIDALKWCAEMRMPTTHKLILWYETRTPTRAVSSLLSEAKRCFTAVESIAYPHTSGPNKTWILACQHMQQRCSRPWFWWEPDCIPLRSEWLTVLQQRYDVCGKPFFGPVVHALNHMNGTAVYPANTPEICPKTMQTRERFGFDVIMRDEMINLCADASDVIQHVWVERNRVFFPYGSGEMPSFPHVGSLSRIHKHAVMFHRVKDGSLLTQLRKLHENKTVDRDLQTRLRISRASPALH